MTSPTAIQLFCFPHAGSSAAGYVRWRSLLPDWVRVLPVELPGRGSRAREPLASSFLELLERVEPLVQPEPGVPFALFGHSLGALLAFEVAWRRQSSGAVPPALLFVAGSAAPALREPDHYARLTTDDELRAELGRLGGTPAGVLADPELMAWALPILRADFQAVADYRSGSERRIAAPIQVLGGAEDATTPELLAGWREHTCGECRVDVLPGGHFFVQQHTAGVIRLVQQRLSQFLDTGDHV